MNAMRFDYDVAEATLPGQTESGDRYVIRPSASGVLIGVVDGLGHGAEAATAAKVAVQTLESAPESSLVSLCRLCHERLKHTRGAVMSLAWLDEDQQTMSWLGVGNVEGRLVRCETAEALRYESLLLRPGFLGQQFPAVWTTALEVWPGDTLVLATDGIEPGFVDAVQTEAPPRATAERIISEHYRRNDDALVLVLRYLGGG